MVAPAIYDSSQQRKAASAERTVTEIARSGGQSGAPSAPVTIATSPSKSRIMEVISKEITMRFWSTYLEHRDQLLSMQYIAMPYRALFSQSLIAKDCARVRPASR